MQTLERIFSDYRHWQAGRPAEARRALAAERLRELGLPGARDEQWRYANLKSLDRIAHFAPAEVDAGAASLPAPIEGFTRIVLDSMRARDHLAGALPAGISLRPPVADNTSLPGADERLALLQQLFGAAAPVLRVEGHARLELLMVAPAEGASYPAVTLEVADGARLDLIERHLGAASTAGLICPHTRLGLAHGAQLNHYRIQDLPHSGVLYDTLSVRLGAQASYRIVQVALGGATTRTTASIRLEGRGAQLHWHGLSAARAGQVSDCRVRADHLGENTSGTAMFRGLAADGARIGFDGDVNVIASAHGARVRQSLRGLLEGSGSEVNLKPRLTILTDQIEASHGATTGQLDENLLFYLLSRGLDAATARALLKSAFLGDALAAIDIAPLRRQVEQSLASHLGDQVIAAALT